jgi:hypothetical protein
MVPEQIDPNTIIETLRQWQSLVPDFRTLTTAETIQLRRAATMPDDWTNAAISTAGESPTIVSAIQSTVEEMREEKLNILRWEAAEQELRVFLKGVAGGNLIRRHRLGLKTLQIYGISRHLIRQPEHDGLITFVEKLKNMRKLGKRKPKGEK